MGLVLGFGGWVLFRFGDWVWCWVIDSLSWWLGMVLLGFVLSLAAGYGVG